MNLHSYHYLEEYKAISDFYSGKCANKSKLPYINHIDEGLFILTKLSSSIETIKAFCLHPILQEDKDLAVAFDGPIYSKYHIGLFPTVLAIEYRSVANEYLAKRIISNYKDIRLSPLIEVNQMLIADKIQNRKDFELYIEADSPHLKYLGLHYFKNWFLRLGIEPDMYLDLVKKIQINRGL